MLQTSKIQVFNLDGAIRGARNPMNSWDKGDSWWNADGEYIWGPNDKSLASRLCAAGSDHRKFLRQIMITVDILAPLYWWKEFDTYKVGTVANSTSTMHKITAKEFTIDDFSYEHLDIRTREHLETTVGILNDYRNLYVNYNPDEFEIKGCPSKKLIWWQIIQTLPSSYNQLRTVTLNYETCLKIYWARHDHKLDEWHTLCDAIKRLPYMEMILEATNPYLGQ